MKRVLVISGSRADKGLLEWPVKVLRDDPYFKVEEFCIWGRDVSEASEVLHPDGALPDIVLLLGDRFEIMAAALNCHLLRVPIAHIGGGDVTEGSYDDAMRDCISRMGSIHFVTSTAAMSRLTHIGCKNVHLVGNPGLDYIRHADWRAPRPFAEPYVVVSYQAETIDGTNEFDKIELPADKRVVFMLPNPDRGSEKITAQIEQQAWRRPDVTVFEFLPHNEYLNLISHCDELIGNSSSMLYEAPELGVKTRMIGKRQRGRTIPWGDGNASKRIAKLLKYAAF